MYDSHLTSLLGARTDVIVALVTELGLLSLRFNGHSPGEPGLAGVY